MVGIDSAHFIPHVLKHHFDIGVDRVFYIDNNSKDNSIELLEEYDNVHIWSQKKIFDQHNHRSGAAWVEELLRQYGVGNWCLLLDLDELFVFPQYEFKSIKSFVREQQNKGVKYVGARHIDMYSKRKVKDTDIVGSLLKSCPYYDKSEHGCRQRVLGFMSYYQKTPLILYNTTMKLKTGYHRVFSKVTNMENDKPTTIEVEEIDKRSTSTGAILHFKFTRHLLDFTIKYGDNMSDSEVKKPLYAATADTNFYDENHSIAYTGSSDLEFFEQYTY